MIDNFSSRHGECSKCGKGIIYSPVGNPKRLCESCKKGGEIMDNEEWMNAMPEDPGQDFESNLFLSTDGKMTVSIKATTPAQRKAGALYAKNMYFWLKENFGSKQAFATKEYKAAESGLGTCSKCGAPNLKSMKGKVYCSNKCWLNS